MDHSWHDAFSLLLYRHDKDWSIIAMESEQVNHTGDRRVEAISLYNLIECLRSELDFRSIVK